jgi:nicotinate-nucleotide adenylyltransferase
MGPEARRRVGIFGGSFDPPHLGHLHVARAARLFADLETLLLMPAARPPHKPHRRLASGEDRAAMLELVCRDLEAEAPGVHRVDRRELTREGPSYSISSAREVLEELGGPEAVELFFVLGSDNLNGLERWREVEALLELAQPIVVPREEHPEERLAALEGALSPAAMQRLRSGLVRVSPLEASSTALRDGTVGWEGVTPEVAEYIAEHGLYVSPSGEEE